jgi:hypothetical protein
VFCQKECARLGEVISQSKPVRSWRCDTGALRRLIETEYLKRLHETEGRIVGPEYSIFHRLRQSVAHALPDAFQDLELTLLPPPIMPLSLSALGKAVVFDLDNPWWVAWWKGRLSREDRLKELDRMIKQEFLPVADDLVSAARTRLAQQVAATLESARVICSSVVEALLTQSEWHAAKMQELLLTNLDKSGDLMGEHQRKLAELHEWQHKWETIGKNLAEIRDRCQLLPGGDPQRSARAL